MSTREKSKLELSVDSIIAFMSLHGLENLNTVKEYPSHNYKVVVDVTPLYGDDDMSEDDEDEMGEDTDDGEQEGEQEGN